MRSFKHYVMTTTIAALALSNAGLAEEPLAPGQPASVKQAQMSDQTTTILGLGLAAVAVAVVIGVSSGSGNSSTITTTTTS